jgi:phospholipase C
VNLISGNTFGATLLANRPNGSPASAGGNISGGNTTGSVIGDPRPGLDDCVVTNPKLQTTNMITMTGTNVGDLLNTKNLTWGWFQGGFAPTSVVNGQAVCGAHHSGLAGDDATTTVGDYIPHHEHSNTTRKRQTSITFHRAAPPRSAKPTRQIISTISLTSGPPSMRDSCRPFLI